MDRHTLDTCPSPGCLEQHIEGAVAAVRNREPQRSPAGVAHPAAEAHGSRGGRERSLEGVGGAEGEQALAQAGATICRVGAPTAADS